MPTKKQAAAPSPSLALIPPEPDTKRITAESSSIAEQARAIVITDAESYARVSALIDAGNEVLRRIGETFDPLIKQAHKQHKDLLATKKTFTDPIDSVLIVKRREMSLFQQEQDRLVRERELQLAEARRKENEALALAEAAELEAEGETQAAEEVIQRAIEAPREVIKLPAFNPNDFGRRSRQVWKWRIVDLAKLPLHFLTVVKNKEGLEQEISCATIGALVRACKSKEQGEAHFNGAVEIWEDRTVY